MRNKSSNKKKKSILKTLFRVEIDSFLKISKIIAARESTFRDIATKIINIFKSVVAKQFCNFIKHIDNIKLQRLWKLYNFENYETIFEIIRRYLKIRKNDILTKKKLHISDFYRRFAIEPPSYYLRFANSK